MAYESIKKGFYNFISNFVLTPIYSFLGDIKTYGKENLEKVPNSYRIVIATTHTNIERSIPIGLALKEQFYLIIKKEMPRWYLKRWWLEPFIRLLNGKWIEGNETRCAKKDLETIAEVIDTEDLNKNEPRYVLIAVSGNFNTDNPEEFIAKRGLALAYKIRLKNNLKKNKTRFNSIIVPSVELMKINKKRKEYIIIYDKQINPNDFIRGKDFDTYALTQTIQSNIRKIMACF
ncbi:MAG: hypothetical protein QXK80_00680 [Candidatus Pacearchaeota archaeon]